jgi:hypothetical protein
MCAVVFSQSVEKVMWAVGELHRFSVGDPGNTTEKRPTGGTGSGTSRTPATAASRTTA